MTPESIKAQVAAIKASGAGGFEANQLTSVPGIGMPAPGYDAATMSWGTPAWTAAHHELFRAGKSAGLRVDQIYTPGWSAGTQTVTPDGPGSAKEIAFGSAWVDAGDTYSGEVPKSELHAGATKRVLQAALAYRCVESCEGSGDAVPVLEPDSAVDLTPRVENGNVTWQAPGEPAAARYVVVGAWMQGTAQEVALAATPKTTYLVDHFGPSGFKAIEDYTEQEVLTPALRAAMRASGGSLFFDSFELNREGEQVRHWTPGFLQAFEKRNGYSLVPYIAGAAVTAPVFDFTGETGQRIREDYNQTLADLLVDNHLLPLKRFAAKYGMTLRGQAYSSWGSGPFDISETAQVLDIPEGEDLSFGAGFMGGMITTEGSDAWRTLAAAAAQRKKKVVSTECCALLGVGAVARQKLIAHVNQQFSVGVNQIVWHGWADSSPGSAPAWPGHAPFGPIVSDIYGPRNPTFTDDRKINTYVGRMQALLRRGTLRNDIAIYRDFPVGHNSDGSNGELYFDDQSLARAGYTYGFIDDTLIADADYTNGRLAADTLGYRALVLDNTDDPANNATMTLATAKRLLSWARDGLPMVVVGDLPHRVRGNHPDQDRALRTLQRKLLAAASVRKVGERNDVLGALRAAKVKSDVRFAKASPLVALHRQAKDADYYHLFNSDTVSNTTSVTLRGRGEPYAYNAWNGTVTPVAQYTRTNGGVRFPVSLASGDSVIYALTSGNADTPGSCATHVSSSSADTLVRAGNRLLVRDAEPGTYRTKLSDGRITSSRITKVGAPVAPTTWTLDVTSWQAGAGGPNDTDKVPLPRVPLSTLPDGTLPDWLTIPGLQNKSGIGVYKTTVDVGPAWTGGTGAYLSLGTVRGLATVVVNGRPVRTINQLDPTRIDIGRHLRPGENSIVVRVSTLLGNAAYGSVPAGPQSYGLIGPVVVTPYGQAAVRGICPR